MLKLKTAILPIALLTFAVGGNIAYGFASNKAEPAVQKSRSKMASILPKEKRGALQFWTRLSGTAAAEGKSVDQFFKDAKAEWDTFSKAHPKVSQIMVKHAEEMAKFRKDRMYTRAKGMSKDERSQHAQDMKAKMLEIKKRHKAEVQAALQEENGNAQPAK